MLLPAVFLSISLILLPGISQAQPKPNALQDAQKKAVLQQANPKLAPAKGTPQKNVVKTKEYLNSAHGSPDKGVLRPDKAKEGFARANCSQCHEFHGGEDVSATGSGREGVYPYTLYAPNFDPRERTGPYFETTDFCFTCHNNKGVAQQVENRDISQRIGCSTLQGPNDILGMFNQKSRHNLYDIWKFLDEDNTHFPWFTPASNPCAACHNTHLARNKKDNPQDVNFSTLSRPTDHDNLWTQSMVSYANRYEPPYCSNTNNRESSGALTPEQARAGMIDYTTFCTDCHNDRNTLISSTLERSLAQVDWSIKGDIHGERAASTSLLVKPPYRANSTQNYILSCLDCHESHGSGNSALLRTWVNGGKLLGTISTSITPPLGTGTDTQNIEMGYLCMRCHQQDSETGTGPLVPPRWQTVHHDAPESPYAAAACETCHEMESPTSKTPLPIECVNCHFHGSTDDWLNDREQSTGQQATGRVTF